MRGQRRQRSGVAANSRGKGGSPDGPPHVLETAGQPNLAGVVPLFEQGAKPSPVMPHEDCQVKGVLA
jgi:hypothetical protein